MPYPVDDARWKFDYSYANEIGPRVLGAVWLLVPAALVALALLVPAALFVIDRVRSRRAQKAYVASRPD